MVGEKQVAPGDKDTFAQKVVSVYAFQGLQGVIVPLVMVFGILPGHAQLPVQKPDTGFHGNHFPPCHIVS